MNAKIKTTFATGGIFFAVVVALLLLWRDANALLGALAGAALGWAAGILLAPYEEEESRFQRLSKGVAGFISGYVVGKMDRIFDLLMEKGGGTAKILDSSLQHTFWIGLICFLVTAVVVFVGRTYWAG